MAQSKPRFELSRTGSVDAKGPNRLKRTLGFTDVHERAARPNRSHVEAVEHAGSSPSLWGSFVHWANHHRSPDLPETADVDWMFSGERLHCQHEAI